MTGFEDNTGRAWTVDLDWDRLERINQLIGANLLDPWDCSALAALMRHPLTFAKVFAVAVPLDGEEDARALSRALRGRCLDDALRALLAEAGDFLPGEQRAAYAVLCERLFAQLERQYEATAEEYRRVYGHTPYPVVNEIIVPPADVLAGSSAAPTAPAVAAAPMA